MPMPARTRPAISPTVWTRFFRYFKQGQPETAGEKRFYTQYLAKDHSMLAFKLLALDPGYEHEISWNYE